MTVLLNSLISPRYASAAMRAIMSDQARLQRMLDFEAALARAEAAVGIISASGAVEIADACRAERYDIGSLLQDASASDLAAVVVETLTREVALQNKTAAGFVHWGACHQDVIDTALSLELRAAIDALVSDLDRAIKGFTSHVGRQRRALIAARAHLQHALPIPVALKLAGYAAALGRSRERLIRLRRDALLLQFGGTAGTLASFAEDGPAVADRLGALLDLPVGDGPWHGHRDRLAEVGACLAIVTGTCAKIARDIAFLMQIEVGEATEPPMSLNSSPNSRNSLFAAAGAAAAAAAIAPGLASSLMAAQVQDHERGLAGAQIEWTTLPMLALVTSGAVEAVARMAEGIELDTDQMRDNLELSDGLIMSEALVFALAEKIGRIEAQQLVDELSMRADQDQRPLKELALADPRVKAALTAVETEKLFVPLTYQGSAQLFIDRMVFEAQSRGGRRSDYRMPEPRPPSSAQTPSSSSIGASAAPSPRPEPPKQPLPPAPQLEPPTRSETILEPSPSLDVREATEDLAEPANQVDKDALSGEEAAPPVAAEATAFDQQQNLGIGQHAAAGADHIEGNTGKQSDAPASKISATANPQSDDAPGAFMDILSRADAEAEAEAAARKRWRD